MYATSGGYGAVIIVLSVALVVAALAIVVGRSSAESRGQAGE